MSSGSWILYQRYESTKYVGMYYCFILGVTGPELEVNFFPQSWWTLYFGQVPCWNWIKFRIFPGRVPIFLFFLFLLLNKIENTSIIQASDLKEGHRDFGKIWSDIILGTGKILKTASKVPYLIKDLLKCSLAHYTNKFYLQFYSWSYLHR